MIAKNCKVVEEGGGLLNRVFWTFEFTRIQECYTQLHNLILVFLEISVFVDHQVNPVY